MQPMTINVFDFDLNRLGSVDDYSYASHRKQWYTYGNFELHIPETSLNAHLFEINNVIMFNTDETVTGIIRQREIETRLGEGMPAGNVWIIRGFTLGGICRQRLTVPTGESLDYEDEASTILLDLVNDTIVNPASSGRAIPNIVLGPDLETGGETVLSTRYQNLAEELEVIAQASGLGWEIYPDFDAGNYVFTVEQGTDRTGTVVFSHEYETIYEQFYMRTRKEFFNTVYVGGDDEGDNREVVTVSAGEPEGIEIFEEFIDARHTDDVSELEEIGLTALKEHETDEIFEAEINPFGSFRYREHWNIGDIVTVRNPAWNVTMDARIIRVEESYGNEYMLRVGFGTNAPNPFDSLQKKIDKSKREVTR